ncbi:glycosyl transferase [Nocardia mangyaensis]|uniref:Glycosyl transferase n=1 Tax=Nocardia mangyaensis TaxID=2213200 RepID=A0A1J0VQA0_9NOCA|nr:glycosyltransferase [Nocardia mangyaensis]APE34186.1 glycosyl transferase [Nocardia mangyaensis]
MRIAMLFYGSRGDIQPGVCLALELQRRGHRVMVAVPPNLVWLAEDTGVAEVVAIGKDTHTAWTSAAAKESLSGRNPLQRAKFAFDTVRAGFAAFDADLCELFLPADAAVGGGVDAAREAGALAEIDLLVVGPLCQERGFAVAERLGVPLVVLRYGPMSENGVIGAIPGMPEDWSPTWKRRSWQLADGVTWLATGWNENSFRRRIGLSAARTPLPGRLRRAGVPQIQGYDPAMVPGLVEEWGAGKPVVGFLDLPCESRPGLGEIAADDPALAGWLAAGASPVFISFGSMPLTDPDAVVDTLRGACRRAGVRALIAVGESRGPGPDDPEVFFIGPVDHSSVLPHCVAAIHHGGAGTTGATLRAGLPTLICAVTADQPFWGDRVRALGVGAGMRIRALTEDYAAAELTALLADQARERAAAFATAMIAPDKAVSSAADIVESRLDLR